MIGKHYLQYDDGMYLRFDDESGNYVKTDDLSLADLFDSAEDARVCDFDEVCTIHRIEGLLTEEVFI